MTPKPTPRATQRPEPFAKPAHWSDAPAPAPAPIRPDPAAEAAEPEGLAPTRYGDWCAKGIAIDF